MRAEAAGDPGPWCQQAILGRSRWDADALRDIVRDYVIETLGAADAILVIDETGFLKQGKASCGVGRQYTGSAGKITNCQIGVFATYVLPSSTGRALTSRKDDAQSSSVVSIETPTIHDLPNHGGPVIQRSIKIATVMLASFRP